MKIFLPTRKRITMTRRNFSYFFQDPGLSVRPPYQERHWFTVLGLSVYRKHKLDWET